MDTRTLIKWFDQHWNTVRQVAAPLLIILLVAVYTFVYMTGGIKYVYSHSMYIPILLSGIVYGAPGGILFGLLGGVVLGPYMPIDVTTGEEQETINWLYRMGFFTLIGLFSGVSSDIAKSHMKYISWNSSHDSLTKLPNRKALLGMLTEILNKKNKPEAFALAILSIENAMELKSAFGFDVIVESILQLAKRCETGKGDRYIFHIDTTQIAILLINGDIVIEKQLKELVLLSREPVNFNDIPIHIDVCIGYESRNKDDKLPETHIQRVHEALAAASIVSQELLPYSPEIKIANEENLSILGGLKRALENGEISLHYQPKIHIATGELHGAEALMRWTHPVMGDIPPAMFIPRAEQSTLIHMVTDFALNQAIQQIIEWKKNGINMQVAVNISPKNMINPGFADSILYLLDYYGLKAEMLELEVTESAFMFNIDHVINELVQLAEAKISISIDDFGTGFSSLQYLHRLPTSIIKIDQSFVKRLPNDIGAVHIVESSISLAHKMGIQALAEGVETKEVFDFVGNIGCDLVQGYMVSRPLPAEMFTQWHQQYDGALWLRPQ